MLATSFVALAALLAAVWIAPRASGAAATWMRTPPVQIQTLRAPGDGRLQVGGPGARAAAAPITLDAGATFSLVALVCDVPAAGSVEIRLRTSVDGHSWGPWFAAPLEVVDEGAVSQAYSEPVYTGAGRYVQARASRGAPWTRSSLRRARHRPRPLRRLQPRSPRRQRRQSASRPRWRAWGSRNAPLRRPPPPPSSLGRSGARTRACAPAPPRTAPVKVAFVHHTAGGNVYSQPDAPGIVRAIYAYHTRSLHWSDIGYNFLIDRYGAIYEGRYGGVSRGVIGAQAGGFNTGSTGVSVLGTFTDVAPPAEAVTSLERLLAWKLGVNGLDPSGSATLTCRLADKYKYGARSRSRSSPVTVTPTTRSARVAPSTRSCPRSARNVKGRAGASFAANLTASASLISPNGDGVLDSTTLTVNVTEAADWRLALKDAGGRVVGGWSG